MIRRRLIQFLLLLISVSYSVNSFAVYNSEAYGEKNFTEYFGARELIYRIDSHSGRIVFEEKEILRFYTESLIQKDLTFLSFFFFNELSQSLSCPQSELNKFYNYFQFSNRVLTLSYLYENIKARETKAKKLNERNICKVDWPKVLGACRPKSNDMNFFVRSAVHISKQKKKVYTSSSSSLKDERLKWLKQLKTNSSSDEASFRLKKECQLNECRTITFNKSMKLLDHSCQEDLTLFKNICSESDQIYGLSYISESYPLLIKSDILDIADEDGYAAGCLQKFKQRTVSKEIIYENLRWIFPSTYNQMNIQKKRYLQGDLFPAGSMKKFIDMGLVDLFDSNKVKVSKVATQNPKPRSLPKPIEDKVEFIDRFKKIKRKKKKLIQQKEEKLIKKKAIRKSSFLFAVDLRRQLDSDEVKVDMERFKYDFLFSIKLKKVLDDNLGNYTTRSGITDMKINDKLGTIKGPIPLIFLKYLIETDKHQSLYTLVSIIGDKFYIQNDIDKKHHDSYNYIGLSNDETTNYKWQITVLRP